MKKRVNIRKIINVLFMSLVYLFPVAHAMEREELTAQIRSEVKRILRNFQRNMDAYYERTRKPKRVPIIPTEKRERSKQETRTGGGRQEQAGREREKPWGGKRGGKGHGHWQNMSEDDRQHLRERRREAWEGLTEEEKRQKKFLWQQRRQEKGDKGGGCRRGGRNCWHGK
jgi:hypothetical protein